MVQIQQPLGTAVVRKATLDKAASRGLKRLAVADIPAKHGDKK